MEDGRIQVSIPFTTILEVAKLELSPAFIICIQQGPDHAPIFQARIEIMLEDHLRKFYGKSAKKKKEAEQEAVLEAIKFLKNTYNLRIRDVNCDELEYLEYKYEYLNQLHEEALEEINELKMKLAQLGGNNM